MRNKITFMKFIKLILLLLLTLCWFGCKKEFFEPDETNILSGQTFKKGVTIQGHKYDNLVIENCTFINRELNIADVNNITIKNCTFKDINGDGIRIGVWGEVNGIIIDNCDFTNIGFNGIYGAEIAQHCVIKNCSFTSVSLSQIGAAMGQPHHSIYWTGKDVLIEDNIFDNGNQVASGDFISLRSSGVIRGNVIRNSSLSNGIFYYPDHPGGDTLLVENNFLFNNKYGIGIISNGSTGNHNKNIIVRFNTSVQSQNYNIKIDEQFSATTNISIYGNILVNPTEDYIHTTMSVTSFNNLTSGSDIGFVSMNGGDLHIKSTSSAINFCSGLTNFPIDDIDHQFRNSSNLDAGADEY